MSKADTHNRLSHEFVMKVVSTTNNHSEMMVVIESAILAAMLVSERVYRIPPAGCVEMVEMAIQQATDRFTEATRPGGRT